MRPISKKNREAIDHDPYYKKCARAMDGGCSGRITIEHTIIYGGRQLDELWSLIPLCEYHHSVNTFQDSGDLNKEKNIWIALNRANFRQLDAISKAVNYSLLKIRLNKKYGDTQNSS